MTVTADPEVETVDLIEGLALDESAIQSGGFDAHGQATPNGLFDADGTITVHVIRPGVGRGKGRHLYEAKMLEEHAPLFAGWPMFIDHLSPEARKAAGGLPRSLRDKGGILRESWWDPSVPADDEKGWGQGAVTAKVRPVKYIRELIDDDPKLVEASISATATGVKPVKVDGQRAWLVEGINPRGSVDWVSEAGAGGRIAERILEAVADEDEWPDIVLESLSDDQLEEHLRAERPHLIEALGDEPSTDPEGGTAVSGITKDELVAALRDNPDVLVEALRETDTVSDLVESAVADERDVIRAQARADAQREVLLAKLEVAAHRQIDEARIPNVGKAVLKERFRLLEGGLPTDALDVDDEFDPESGEITKPASVVLREAIQAQIDEQTSILAEAHPTRVRGQGASRRQPGEEATTAGRTKPADTGWGKYLQENGIDPASAYGIRLEEAAPAGE